ncbi:TIGR01459 family HAD-type hydrolase [Candidatus Pelagibacter sp. HIMB1321]|uniref:TIGR01459 family HAD-type hydrolase n=1 Tax=Candidatus Pelagibacter sp. HIMB1321 TaxID=1388755 RepID=UPI000A07FC10|nr:TIGR01459 family HAD-type hydrolase [Candidatus Pelagibacter sp. HIMB1321]SMF70555.1 HAD-superfamily class IIA hydrolase, TIGR01459 [Candidatus Pelagibacter sp. HIMB1321]
MTKNLDKDGLSSIAKNYDLFYIDLWGVLHNGISLHQEAVKVLNELEQEGKEYVLLTNAPRPSQAVRVFLKNMQLDEKIRNHVFSSGEASLNYLKNNFANKKFYHIGPPRDFDLFKEFEKDKSQSIENSEYLLCTGLFEKYDKDLNYYKDLFEKNINKQMICTNPDLIVDKGDKRELCAGSVAMVFEKMGGKVTYFGKPYSEVYNQSIDNKNKKVLCIGDNLNTDIKGANLLNYDSLLISNGVHKKEIEEKGIDVVSKNYEAICNFTQSELKW